MWKKLLYIRQLNIKTIAIVGSPASNVRAWGARGRRFESSRPDQNYKKLTNFGL